MFDSGANIDKITCKMMFVWIITTCLDSWAEQLIFYNKTGIWKYLQYLKEKSSDFCHNLKI